jgi:hypothetical protein
MLFNPMKLFTAMVLLTIISFSANAQLKVPAPSPLQTVKQNFGISDFSIEYSRPGVKGRVIYGDLVPYGKIWRTGANATTKITFTDDVKIEGNVVSAGSYGIYTIPNKDSWDIMLYKDLTLGGNVNDYKPENELLRFKVKSTSLSEKVETFTINIADVTPTSATIELLWEKTRVAFNITTEIDAKIMKSITETLATDKRPYYTAATYYYDNDKDMNQALAWVNKAIEMNPKAYYMVHMKAKIQVKLKDYKGALESAEQSLAMAKEQKSDEYIKMNEKLIADVKKMK